MPQPYTGDIASNGKRAEKTAEKAQEKASDMMAHAKSTVEDMSAAAREKISDTAEAVGEKSSELAGRIQQSSVYTTACRTVREQPVATLAGAVAIGFMAGALWKLSRSHTTAERLADRVSAFAEPHMRSLKRNIWG